MVAANSKDNRVVKVVTTKTSGGLTTRTWANEGIPQEEGCNLHVRKDAPDKFRLVWSILVFPVRLL